MDHYKVLELNRNASKEEIKEAFRKLAFKFHPDKHSQSSKAIRNNATLRFKQVSEAYEVLSDDRKRADYNIRSRAGGSSRNGFPAGAGGGYGYNYYQHNYNYGGNGNAYKPRYRAGSGSNFDGFTSKFEVALRYLTTRAFLLNLGFAGALLGGMVVIDMGRDSIWKMHNSGKSFEEAMEYIEKAKAQKP
ncbi:chaperone protein dnaJ 72 [Quillaja saponaria]|uniref:Chaperone protein dnaJ 72 n=1 Tax=Quillaja saponaria TaxID=32244 RepID=A0AAD7Q7U5_QUISA|nr:chaperone protein dnaJ 72 [Quillaja saponaria]